MTLAAAPLRPTSLVIVGGVGGTNVGQSLFLAAQSAGLDVRLMNSADAMSKRRILQTGFWYFGGRRPVHLNHFCRSVEAVCAEIGTARLIATGAAPLTAAALLKLRAKRILSINFSTDDPFNSVHRASWHLEALRAYDVVVTPRRSVMADLKAIGCSDVRYLPFGYDDTLFGRQDESGVGTVWGHDVLFVGGGDRDRAAFFFDFMKSDLMPTLVGSYWDRYAATRSLSIGHLPPEELRVLTARAAVNLCLVRRANRDGHVMRSFEIPACGGFMIAEDTEEHREIFGREGECVLYFTNAAEAAEKTKRALADPASRRRMAFEAHKRIIGGAHTYRDRLNALLEVLPG